MNAATGAFGQRRLPSMIAALAVGLLVVGCGGGSGTSPSASPTPDAPSSASPTPDAPSSAEVVERPGRTMNEGDTVRLDGRGSFGSGRRALSYAWRQTGGTPRVVLRDADTATPSFDAPNLAADAVLTFRMTATDADGVVVAVVVETVTVRADNDPPTANAGTDRMVGGGSVTLDGSRSTDPEGGSLTFAWAQTGGSPTVALGGAGTARPTFSTPQLAAQTDLTFTLTVTDSGGLSANDTVTVTVRADNDPPTANAGADRTTYEGDSVTLDGSGSSDPEGGTLAFAWTQTGGSPTVTLGGAGTARPTFSTPQLAAQADLTFTLTVTDSGGLSASDTVTVTVRADNDPPTANAGADRTTYEGDSVTLDGSRSTDPEGGSLTFAWAQTGGSPTVALGGAGTARPTFSTPQLAAQTDLTFTLTVTDPGGVSASDTVTVTVRADDDPPTANAGADRTTYEGDSVTLDGSRSTDPEGGALAFAWAQTGGSPTVTLGGAGTARPTFSTPQLAAQADLTFTLTVTDPGGASASDTVTVTVRADDDPPTADAGADRTVDDGGSVTLDGSGSSDPEGRALAFAWAQTGGSPTVALSSASTAAASFTAPQLAAQTDLTFTLTVTDPGGASASDTVTVTVRADNDLPTANAGTDLTADEGDPVTLDGSGSTDPEGGTLTFAWTQTGGPPTAALSSASTAAASFTAPQLAAQTDLTFTLTVTDPGGLSASDTVTVTVRAVNDAPSANAGIDRTVDDGDPVTLDGSGSSDPESGVLTYAWAQTGGSPTVTLSGAGTARPTFSAPELTANADLTFTLTVTDPGGQSATATVTITVRADEDAPIAYAGADRTTYEGDSVTLDGSGSSDPEGGTLTWAWTQTGGSPTASLSGASTAAATFTAPTVTADARLRFTLTVTDPGGLSATDFVTITVKNVRPAGSTVRTPASGETLEPATAKSTASSWETAEYTASVGLPLINAAAGYAARTMGNPGGGGVTIAVIDAQEVDADHPDLAGVTVIHTGAYIWSLYRGMLAEHGTRVTGVAAARRNGVGMHGVAYNANIVHMSQGSVKESFRAAFASAAGLTGTYYRSYFTADPAGSAHIASISYTGLGTSQEYEHYADSVRLMTGRGRIVVSGTGNAGGSEPEGVPASTFADEGIAGFAIAATALNAAGTGQASWANRCGAVKQYCLMAPGTRVYTTQTIPASNPARPAYATRSGTSYSAPYTAGAAAVVWAAFPNKTASQIVDRLLTTARQIDATNCAYDSTTGVSDKCGHGVLDLGAAMNPVGFTSMSLPGSGMAPVRGTVIRLPPGARVRADPVLADAVVYDEQGFPFLHDLNGHFVAGGAGASSGSVLDGFLGTGDREWTVTPLGEGVSFSFAGPARGGAGTAAERAWSARGSSRHEPMRDYRLSFRPRAGLALTVGRGAGAPAVLNGFAALPGRWDLFQDGLSVRPFTAFAGQGLGLGVDWQVGRTSLGFAARNGGSRFGASRASLASLGLTRRFGGGLTANASWGTLRERGARLGMRSFGGFGAVPGTSTTFIDVSVEKTVFGGTVLFGSYSQGVTRAQAGKPGGLVRGWGEFRADALALGVEVPSVLVPSDRVTATVTAPFQPRGRVAEVLVPVREELDGVVEYALRTVGLASAGRELRTQLVYEAWSSDDTALTVGGWKRFAPGEALVERDWGVGVKIRRGF